LNLRIPIMQKKTYQFSAQKVSYYFDADFVLLNKLVDSSHSILITDEHIYNSHQKKFSGWKTIVLKAGEQYKIQSTVDSVIDQLIAFGADRKSLLVGIGGGVVTDITGYAAAVYMRGIRFGFLPTSILSMVDASIGGKNGIDVGLYKNLVGTIRQPEFLLYDLSLLKSLPDIEWSNGFAEIIKHAAIKDARLFNELSKRSISYYKKNKKELAALIRRNVIIKSEVVKADEFERGERKLLNFGHTLGHAIENSYGLSHGQAISIGMVAAAIISEEFTGFREAGRISHTLSRYGLPTALEFDPHKVFDVLKLDKKKIQHTVHYILLQKIGKAKITAIPIDQLEKLVHALVRPR
jgi:3-dehydroquinate synthase